MNFCFVRLGKSSVDEIHQIDSLIGAQQRNIIISIECTQVPGEAVKNTYCFIWLGSDNNKGTPTLWKQGLRAVGIITGKEGGPGYKDQWRLKIKLIFVFKTSVNKHDLLEVDPSLYTEYSEMPIIGLAVNSNQTVQMIKQGEEKQNLSAFLEALTKLNPDFNELAGSLLPLNDHHTRLFRLRLKKDKQAEFKFLQEPEAQTAGQTEASSFEEPENIGSEAIAVPFDPTKIDIRPQPLTIISLIKRLQSDPIRLDMKTAFQRKENLWSKETQSRLIESLLVRIPLPAFYFDGTSDIWLIVDGLQRISSLRNFILEKNFKLTGLEYLRNFEGHGWDDLPPYLQSRIEETAVTAYIINPGTPEEVKFNIFKRINTSGLILTPQEIRNALNNGKPSKLVADLAAEPLFETAMGGKVPSARMQDQDYVARFLGFYLDEEKYQPDLDSFLNAGMSKLKYSDDGHLARITGDFTKSMKFAHSIFGDNAFRKPQKNGRKMPINKALFECVSVILAKMKYSELTVLEAKRTQVNMAMNELLAADQTFLAAITSGTGDVKSVQNRYSIVRALFKRFLND